MENTERKKCGKCGGWMIRSVYPPESDGEPQKCREPVVGHYHPMWVCMNIKCENKEKIGGNRNANAIG